MPKSTAHRGGRPRACRGRLACAALTALAAIAAAAAAPRVPTDDNEVLAQLPAGTTAYQPADSPAGRCTARRGAAPGAVLHLPGARFRRSALDSAMPSRCCGRGSGVRRQNAAALVLHATILQSRHSFDAALVELDEALRARPDDAQAWLTRATVLRVQGRYSQAAAACERFARRADTAVSRSASRASGRWRVTSRVAYATACGPVDRGTARMRSGRGVTPSWARWPCAWAARRTPSTGFGRR